MELALVLTIHILFNFQVDHWHNLVYDLGLVKLAILEKQAYHAGRGLNIWNNVHILDLADLYSIVLEQAHKGKAPVNKDGYYFAENGEHNFLDLTDEIARVLHARGASQSDKSKEMTKELEEKYK